MSISYYYQQTRVHYKNYLFLLIICLLAYWPITFGIFSVKNDAIHYFLPYRFNISEAIRNGEMPLWSPYIYSGNPIMGDMQSSAWNPIVWLFSIFGRYDVTLFHMENLLYIFLGGIGMYKFTNRLVAHSHTALLIAASYMLSGFMLGGQLINWLSAAAFIPFILHYYLLTLNSPNYSNAIKTAVVLFLLFTSSYPSFFILTVYLLLLLFVIQIIKRIHQPKTTQTPIRKFIIQHFLLIIVFSGLSLPAIISYIDLLPYYQRGEGTSYADAITNMFDAQHFLTLLFPSSIKANDIVSVTDVTCRNIYFGIFPLLLLLIFPPALNRRNIQLLCLALFAIFFSLGDTTPLRKICYQFIPLMDTFRHPSQMRLFFIFALLLLAAPGVKKLLINNLSISDVKKIKTVLWVSSGLLFLVSIIVFLKSSMLDKISAIKKTGISTFLKTIFDEATLVDTIFLNAALQLLFIVVALIATRKYSLNRSAISFLWVTNLIVMAQMVLPASFVSKTSAKEINILINSAPTGFPTDDLELSLSENSKDAFTNFNTIGLSYFYNKKTGISRITNSPAFLLQLDKFIQTDLLYNYVAAQPIAYIADSVVALKDTIVLRNTSSCRYAFSDSFSIGSDCNNQNKAVVKNISANRFIIETNATNKAFLVLTQNYYHHWQVEIDNAESEIVKTNLSFMGTFVPPGKHTVTFVFNPINIKRAAWISLAVVLLLIITVTHSIYNSRKSNR